MLCWFFVVCVCFGVLYCYSLLVYCLFGFVCVVFRLHVVGLVAVVVCGVVCVFSGGALPVVIGSWILFLAMLHVYLCVITDWVGFDLRLVVAAFGFGVLSLLCVLVCGLFVCVCCFRFG